MVSARAALASKGSSAAHALLARVGSETDRWAVITGGPGMGKSALLTAWLARREVSGAAMPITPFVAARTAGTIPRGWLLADGATQGRISRPCARRTEQAHASGDTAGQVLSRASETALRSHLERLVIVIDGLDEYDRR